MNRLALGTVQFGLPYGVANSQGRISFNEIEKILNYAQLSGVDTLDTAIAYGDSEEILGKIGVDSFRIISKLPSIPNNINIGEWIEESVYNSSQRLKIPRLYGLLLHDPKQLLDSEGDEIFEAINNLKKNGLVDKLGISIYSPEELDDLCVKFSFDLVQAPFNILDRRLEESGWLLKLKAMNVEVHVRSIFLQGLLLMDSSERPLYFSRWNYLWKNWENFLCDNHLSNLQACLNHTMSNHAVDRIIVGVDSLYHLQEIIYASKYYHSQQDKNLSCDDLDLINPSYWKYK
jgi:aryl-alcohol dehydrogenase-like predicted oxidoreductase